VLQTMSRNLFWLSKGEVAVLTLGRKVVDYLVHYQRVHTSRVNINFMGTSQVIPNTKTDISGLGTQGIYKTGHSKEDVLTHRSVS
jgi:hypothetical protein